MLPFFMVTTHIASPKICQKSLRTRRRTWYGISCTMIVPRIYRSKLTTQAEPWLMTVRPPSNFPFEYWVLHFRKSNFHRSYFLQDTLARPGKKRKQKSVLQKWPTLPKASFYPRHLNWSIIRLQLKRRVPSLTISPCHRGRATSHVTLCTQWKYLKLYSHAAELSAPKPSSSRYIPSNVYLVAHRSSNSTITVGR